MDIHRLAKGTLSFVAFKWGLAGERKKNNKSCMKIYEFIDLNIKVKGLHIF